jgi:FtsH-binding integral membrane protein
MCAIKPCFSFQLSEADAPCCNIFLPTAAQAVLLAFLVTAVAVACITIFAINTKIDVTKWGTLLLVALVAFVVLLLVGMFWVNRILYLVIAGFACLLFSAYLLYDIQVGCMWGFV